MFGYPLHGSSNPAGRSGRRAGRLLLFCSAKLCGEILRKLRFLSRMVSGTGTGAEGDSVDSPVLEPQRQHPNCDHGFFFSSVPVA